MNIEISPKEYERQLNWYDAMMYCELLSIDEKDDWRLPTIDELDYIDNSENDFDNEFYWSSTEYYGNSAWFHYFSDGQQFGNFKTHNYYVRAVRSLSI
jgi:formylglycine-generating enzyme required for sulfatase activity